MSENDGYDFKPILSFSRSKFINVSAESRHLDTIQARALGWREGTEVLWICGSGRYRSSPAYLAAADLSALIDTANAASGDGPVELDRIMGDNGPVRFFTGSRETVSWSRNEQDAVPLFCAGDIGELSCRHNETFGRFFITYNSGNPRGIILRHATQPWGQWSDAIVIFDPGWGSSPGHPAGAGYGVFMHVPWNLARVDNVQDDMFLGGRRDNDWAGEYGPYQVTRFSTGVANERCDLLYAMSTWNPYESMLMHTRVTAQDLGL